MTNILLVEDDKEIVKNLSLFLRDEGFRVKAVSGQKDALEQIEEHGQEIDLVLLDVSLEDGNGFAVCAAVKANTEIPVIFLTASGDEYSTVTGLDMGADDYIAKPFNPLELMARVKAQLRRSTKYNEGNRSQEDIIDFGGLFLNRNTHECIYNERELTLTPIEFDILWILCENRGQVISSEQLFEQVWKEKYYKNSNNTVMVHIRHLREKMSGPTGKSDFIKTVWGVGYRVEK